MTELGNSIRAAIMDENVFSTVHKIDAKILSSGMSTNKHVTLL